MKTALLLEINITQMMVIITYLKIVGLDLQMHLKLVQIIH